MWGIESLPLPSWAVQQPLPWRVGTWLSRAHASGGEVSALVPNENPLPRPICRSRESSVESAYSNTVLEW